MKIKVGQKVRIGKSAKCIKALENFYIDIEAKPVLGRIATVREITTFEGMPAVHLNFRNKHRNEPGHITNPTIYWPVSVLRKP